MCCCTWVRLVGLLGPGFDLKGTPSLLGHSSVRGCHKHPYEEVFTGVESPRRSFQPHFLTLNPFLQQGTLLMTCTR